MNVGAPVGQFDWDWEAGTGRQGLGGRRGEAGTGRQGLGGVAVWDCTRRGEQWRTTRVKQSCGPEEEVRVRVCVCVCVCVRACARLLTPQTDGIGKPEAVRASFSGGYGVKSGRNLGEDFAMSWGTELWVCSPCRHVLSAERFGVLCFRRDDPASSHISGEGRCRRVTFSIV